jgi:hypothetical protein
MNTPGKTVTLWVIGARRGGGSVVNLIFTSSSSVSEKEAEGSQGFDETNRDNIKPDGFSGGEDTRDQWIVKERLLRKNRNPPFGNRQINYQSK